MPAHKCIHLHRYICYETNNLLSSVSTDIFDVLEVTIEQEAFSKLYNSTFKNVKKLILQEKSFDFKNQGHLGRHGPVTVISFDNVSIPELPREVFLKPLASVSFLNSVVGDIQEGAFKAAEISAVTMISSVFGHFREGAFTDRTLICDFKISKSSISRLRSRSIMAAIGNFTLSHSIITDIESRALMSTIAKVEIVGNQIVNFNSHGFVFNNWNKITVDDNIIKHLYPNFLEAPNGADIEKFSFKGNEIYQMDDGALSFSHSSTKNSSSSTTTSSTNPATAPSTNGWKTLPTTLRRSRIINIHNFTERTCANFTVCEPYEGKTRVVDTTSKIFLPEDDSDKQSWLIFMITVVGLFILAILVTFIVLLVRGSRWLKEKGYFRNVHYANNELSHEDEGTIVTLDDDNEMLEIPEELTLEFLQILSKRLDDPNTHQEASEMIERLYEMFIIDDGYENNNRQEEEAHLYEELGNLNLQIPPPPYEEEKESSNGPRSILKLMEEKFNQQTEGGESSNSKPPLVSDYSEPTDSAVHLYSELKNKSEKSEIKDNRGTLKSNGFGSMRPLPGKPSETFDVEAGPSTKF
ncbi:hypothetical protein JTB14_006593 [Gonioctena quinquepunctata]|nr:hypothetical protein JTB14_006593 [Gonioctena quinquepunctata]